MRKSDTLIRSLAIELASYKLAVSENRTWEAVLMLQRLAEDVDRLIRLNTEETVIIEKDLTTRIKNDRF